VEINRVIIIEDRGPIIVIIGTMLTTIQGIQGIITIVQEGIITIVVEEIITIVVEDLAKLITILETIVVEEITTVGIQEEEIMKEEIMTIVVEETKDLGMLITIMTIVVEETKDLEIQDLQIQILMYNRQNHALLAHPLRWQPQPKRLIMKKKKSKNQLKKRKQSKKKYHIMGKRPCYKNMLRTSECLRQRHMKKRQK